MRKTLRVSVLVLLLTGSASAGIIQNESPAPASQQTSATDEPTANGIMQNDAPYSLTQTVLDLLAVLL